MFYHNFKSEFGSMRIVKLCVDAVGLGVIGLHIHGRVDKKLTDFDFRTPKISNIIPNTNL